MDNVGELAADCSQLLDEQGFQLRGSNSSAVRKAQQFYTACMNVTAVEQQGRTPLLKVLNDKL